ncbi:MAG: hypothetical protein K5886_11165 [Lachnospiraceae bacterium]|nr:hypothetical protein [Lachnospiraceae bacterium]
MSVKKGCRDYIRKNRIFTLVRTLIMFTASIGIYFIAKNILGTNKNLFTVMAVLLILPAAKSAVNCIMFYKADSVKEDFYREVEGIRGDIPVLYDLIFTTYEKTFQADALLYSNNCVILYSGRGKKQKPGFEDYLKSVLSADLTIILYSDRQAFFDRIAQMKIRHDTSDKRHETLFEKIRAIVL